MVAYSHSLNAQQAKLEGILGDIKIPMLVKAAWQTSSKERKKKRVGDGQMEGASEGGKEGQ